ncbi:DUF6364 family protein [Lewinella sp. IMCC34183]|uniref:DUF6364 family protein n=1 Tax=Lewinella sp. IMCC34183 TaxID=2248762 RepID=UPI003977BF1B
MLTRRRSAEQGTAKYKNHLLSAATIDRAKEFGRNRATNLSRMIEQYGALLTAPEGRGGTPTYTSLVDRLSGVVNLPDDEDRYRADYTAYLVDKHG